MLSPRYIILKIQSVDLDEVAHNEPPHQDLRCLQIQLFSSLILKELIPGSKQVTEVVLPYILKLLENMTV